MTVLMPSWYYEKRDFKHSPSILDGLNAERESRYRREGARFIINVGTKMGLRYDTMATGVVYFHRFYMFHSFKTFPRYVTACCCLFLAGKVEETPKKCKDIIKTAKSFLAETQFTQFGDDPEEEVMTLERILLQTIKFDLQVDHPYGHLLKYAKSLNGDKLKLQNMVQMAWTFINDSLCTTLCLQFEPEVIAIALMYLAGKLNKFEVVDWIGRTTKQGHWWDMFVEGMSVDLLEDICHQVLDLYSTPMSDTPQDSPPATPPTKSTRRVSQPPSPVETITSPAQLKPKEVLVGQPIPRLEPGELKRKSSILEAKKDHAESKLSRVIEGKPITTITSSPKANSSLGSDTQPSSPSTPTLVDSSIKTPDMPIRKNTSDLSYRLNTQPYTHVMPQEALISKPASQTLPVAVTSYPLTVPPPTVSYTQSGPPYYSGVTHETVPFPTPNIQQPPPQIFPQRNLQFQHLPPPVTPSGSLPNVHHPPPPSFVEQSYPSVPPSNVPAFNSPYPPPPRHQPPPSLLGNPPPPGPPPGISSHPPPNIRPPTPRNLHPRIPSDGIYAPRPDMYQEQRGSLLSHDHREFSGHHGRFEGDSPRFRGRRNPDYDLNYPPRPRMSGQFGQERPPMARRFSMEHQPHRSMERGPPSRMPHSSHQGASSTGIPPVRITGSM